MRRNNVSHIGANSQFGGVIGLLLRPAYQVGIESYVKRDPMPPDPSVMIRDNASLAQLTVTVYHRDTSMSILFISNPYL